MKLFIQGADSNISLGRLLQVTLIFKTFTAMLKFWLFYFKIHIFAFNIAKYQLNIVRRFASIYSQESKIVRKHVYSRLCFSNKIIKNVLR